MSKKKKKKKSTGYRGELLENKRPGILEQVNFFFFLIKGKLSMFKIKRRTKNREKKFVIRNKPLLLFQEE